LPRKLRVWHPGEVYHITSRGNRKELIFADRRDYEKYLKLLIETKHELPFNLHAYCLMPNHVHLLIQMLDESISKIVKKIHTRYAIYFNKRYQLIGHVFQDRFHSTIVHSADYLLEVTRYIHLNPVKASMVKNPEEFVWSSHQAYLKRPKQKKSHINLHSQLPISTERVLSHFPEPREQRFNEFVNKKIDQESIK
jgi:putative transposase